VDAALNASRAAIEELKGVDFKALSDHTLTRFVVARNLDINAAKDMLIFWLKWRVQTDPERITPESCISHMKAGRGRTRMRAPARARAGAEPCACADEQGVAARARQQGSPRHLGAQRATRWLQQAARRGQTLHCARDDERGE
jgi:hypothetical protein